MRIVIEKTEAGYNITNELGTIFGVGEIETYGHMYKLFQTPLPPKEPAIPACLHCKSTSAPTMVYGVIECFVRCDRVLGGCGSESGARNSEAEALALWAGVKQ